MQNVTESEVNIISQGSKITGNITFDHVTRVHGVLEGDIKALEGSTLILSESAVVEGNIFADTLVVDGYVRGDIQAKTKVVISGTGRVIGNIKTKSLSIEFGAYFEGKSFTEHPEPSNA